MGEVGGWEEEEEEGLGGHCCSRHVASVGYLRSAALIIPRHSGQ